MRNNDILMPLLQFEADRAEATENLSSLAHNESLRFIIQYFHHRLAGKFVLRYFSSLTMKASICCRKK